MNTQAPVTLDPADWMEQALGVLALKLRHEVALTRALRGPERQEGFLGLFVSDTEAEALLDELSGQLESETATPSEPEVGRRWAHLAALRRSDPSGIWVGLARAFDLAEAELDLLLLAAAPALDPRFGRVFGFLNDDMGRRHLTPALAQRLLSHHSIDALTMRRMLSSGSPLCRHGLLDIDPARPAIERPLRIDEDLLDRLLGDTDPLPDTASCMQVISGGAKSRFTDTPPCLLFHEEKGHDSGADILARTDAENWALALILLDAVPPDQIDSVLRTCLRECRIAGAVPVVFGLDALPAPDRGRVAPLLSGGSIVLSRDPAGWLEAGLMAQVVVAQPVPQATRSFWIERLTDRHPMADDTLREMIEGAHHLGLLNLAWLLGRYPRRAAFEVALKARMYEGLKGLARPVILHHSLDDLVVPDRSRRALESLINARKTCATVLEDWGLGPVFSKNRGTTVLFRGPSGTGKTMAAGVVARAVGLPLFRVDLASMISKFIGETEKNLERLFQAAESTDVILFFDEADAIFGQRSEISDAHDRYANLETSYLLQRLETFDGIAILASNLHQNIDDAFLRRIDKVVDFPAPGPAERLALWHRIRQTKAKVSNDVDLEALADRFELTGGEIRNCWLDAAHRAVGEGQMIGMGLLIQAVGNELVKQGKPIRKADFGAHYAGLRCGGVIQ